MLNKKIHHVSLAVKTLSATILNRAEKWDSAQAQTVSLVRMVCSAGMLLSLNPVQIVDLCCLLPYLSGYKTGFLSL